MSICHDRLLKQTNLQNFNQQHCLDLLALKIEKQEYFITNKTLKVELKEDKEFKEDSDSDIYPPHITIKYKRSSRKDQSQSESPRNLKQLFNYRVDSWKPLLRIF